MRIAVAVSSEGSNLEALVKAGVEIALVFADGECPAIEKAAKAGIPTQVIDRNAFGYAPKIAWRRQEFTLAAVMLLHLQGIDLLVMAGFRTLWSPIMFEYYGGRVINIHPSLFVNGSSVFPGWHAVQDAIDAKVWVTGCTVHIATAGVDVGPVLAEARVVVLIGDTKDILHERIKREEHELYSAVIKSIVSGEIQLEKVGQT